MKSFSQYITEVEMKLNERYINMIGDDENKKKYVDEVWDLLQKAYAKIGGIKGSGFRNKEDMIKNIPFWKINKKNGKIKTVVMYKDKQGRKLIATATDGSDEAIEILKRDMKQELNRSFVEKSGPALGLTMKTLPFDVIEAFAMKPSEVKKVIKDDIITLKDYDGEIDQGDQRTLNKFQQLKPYFYFRKLGDKYKMKIMLGTPGKFIK